MASHDIVAQRDYLPKLQEVTFDDFDDEEETVKMVQLVKTQDPTVRPLYTSFRTKLRAFPVRILCRNKTYNCYTKLIW